MNFFLITSLKWSMILLRGPNVILLNQITKINILIYTNIVGGGGGVEVND